MSDGIFDLVSQALERRSDLGKLEARGTVRLALKEAGLDARAVTREQMEVMLTRVMPRELRCRGIADPEPLCEAIRAELAQTASDGDAATQDSPEAIFRRLAET